MVSKDFLKDPMDQLNLIGLLSTTNLEQLMKCIIKLIKMRKKSLKMNKNIQSNAIFLPELNLAMKEDRLNKHL